MREIKFRAYEKAYNVIREVVSINFADKTVVLKDDFFDDVRLLNFNQVVLMQYTGLNDKNNVEICVGDIVLHGLCKYEIKFEAGFVMRDISGLNPDFALCAAWQQVATDSFEVVGNLWENTEL